MGLSLITGQAFPAKTGTTLLARLRGQGGQLVTQASISAIAYAITDLTTGVTVATGSLTVSAVLFDTLQQDPIWTRDSASLPGPDGSWGYNFKTTLAAASIANGGDRYRADVKLTPVSGEPFIVLWEWKTLAVYV